MKNEKLVGLGSWWRCHSTAVTVDRTKGAGGVEKTSRLGGGKEDFVDHIKNYALFS